MRSTRSESTYLSMEILRSPRKGSFNSLDQRRRKPDLLEEKPENEKDVMSSLHAQKEECLIGQQVRMIQSNQQLGQGELHPRHLEYMTSPDKTEYMTLTARTTSYLLSHLGHSPIIKKSSVQKTRTNIYPQSFYREI